MEGKARDGLAGRGTRHQTWEHVFDPWDTHGGRREQTPTCTAGCVHRDCTHMHINPDDTSVLETSAASTTILLLNSSDNKMLDLEGTLTPRKLSPKTLG